MKINYKCLPCLVNQVVRVADMTNADHRETLFQDVFRYLSEINYTETNPEIIGSTFRLLKEHLKNNDPYLEIRNYYNDLFLNMNDLFEKNINQSDHSFETAIKYAIMGNMIDFNPIHASRLEDIMKYFESVEEQTLPINHTQKLISDIQESRTLLYIGDNCGEICLDKILIQKIKEYNPNMEVYFGVRGTPVVNDSIEADAHRVGIDAYAKIISNGDDSLGTVLTRTSEEFNHIYQKADVVISKGQANYESLSEQKEKNIYYLLMVKCDVIADDIGATKNSMICINSKRRDENICQK
jgi:damage-control phosphatase, subfamily I